MGNNAKQNNSNNEKISHNGSCCGEFLGCLIILTAVAAILFWFVAKPRLEQMGWSFDGMKEKMVYIKELTWEFIDDIKGRYDSAKGRVEKIRDNATTSKDRVSSKINEIKQEPSTYSKDLLDSDQMPKLIPG